MKTTKLRSLLNNFLQDIDTEAQIDTKTANAIVDAHLRLFQAYSGKIRRETAKEIVEFLDGLEINQPFDLKTDNWRNWKYIKNSIVDEYGVPSQADSLESNG